MTAFSQYDSKVLNKLSKITNTFAEINTSEQ